GGLFTQNAGKQAVRLTGKGAVGGKRKQSQYQAQHYKQQGYFSSGFHGNSYSSLVISGLANFFSASSATRNMAAAATVMRRVNSPGERPSDSLSFTGPL